MKKILKLIVILMTVFVVGIKGVKAETVNITQQFVDNVWSFHYRNGSVWTFGNLPYNYANGNLVYCIQPDARINTNSYNVYSDFTMSGYSDEVRQKMELISYYGYGYPGHTSLKYYMATQELLWLFSPDESIKWTVGNTDDTSEIDVSREKNEINRLISTHNVLPSFLGNKELVVNEDLVLTDSNNVLDKYNIVTSGDITYRILGNKLILKASKLGTYSIKFVPKQNYNDKTYIYDNFSIRTQTLASFGKPSLKEGSMTVTSNKVKVEIQKKDKDTNEVITTKGIKVKIKNIETNEYIGETYEFNNGHISIALPVGKYILEEVETEEPYSLNSEKLEFEITNDDTKKELDFYNEKSKGKITINKNNEKGDKLSDVEFEVYDEEGNVVDTIITNNGLGESTNLPLGNYTVKETKELYGYEKNDTEYFVSLTYIDQNTPIVEETLDIVNKKIKCLITYITTSGEEKIDATFNIYTKDGDLVYTGKTVEGKASIELEYGDYIIKEIDVPNGYKLNDEEISFSVNDKVCASTMKVNNEKVNMPITSTESNIAYLLMLLFNIGGYVFIKKDY